jgi:DNA sulfur modification protein DndD
VGTHEINLTPESRDKPIILFGGFNGGGKTTLLDAIQLALFGKLSRCSTRGSLAYDEFLKRCISRTAPEGSGASISLEIRQTFDAQTHEFEITRSWIPAGKGVGETLIVRKDNVVDPDLAENWLEHVDQFVPVGLAELFFFDGEQIARLAEADNAAQMLTTAINTLLGIDLVDRLERDLTVYERDVSKSGGNGAFGLKSAEHEATIGTLHEEQKRLIFERGRLQGEADHAQRRVEHLEAAFRQQGGELFNRRSHLSAQLDSLHTQIARSEDEIREIAGGMAPLLLAGRLIDKVRKQAALEESAETQRLMLSELEKRDKGIIAAFKKSKQSTEIWRQLESLFQKDRLSRAEATKVKPYLNLEKSAVQMVQGITHAVFEEIRSRSTRLVREGKGFVEQAERIQETLARVPDEGAIAQISEQLATAQKEHVRKNMECVLLSERLEASKRRLQEEEQSMISLLEKNASASAEQDDMARRIRFAARTRETMRQFRVRVLERKIKQIEDLILESFQRLLRKTDLVASLKIDPNTYRMTLYSATGGELHTDRLSAGERQLLAISTLWGLARASGRPLPTIIDTPLGRLDSLHRSNLVENYFPYASHQVIILSTDEEIDEKHLATLRPKITRSFELSYSSENQSTSLRQGYFFN